MSDVGKALIAGGVLVGGLLFLSRRRKGGSVDMQLSLHFKLSEFLRSTAVPEVAQYKPTDTEISNARILCVTVLEPARDLAGGPLVITGGGRPPSVHNAKGETFVQALREQGDSPAEHSDHEVFDGADFILQGTSTAAEYVRVYTGLRALPTVRQVILYFTTDVHGQLVPHHLHVAAVVPGRPRLGDDVRAFVTVDGKRTDQALNV